jgi:hypothetical protein
LSRPSWSGWASSPPRCEATGSGGLFDPWVPPNWRFGMLMLAAKVSAWELALRLLP